MYIHRSELGEAKEKQAETANGLCLLFSPREIGQEVRGAEVKSGEGSGMP